MGGVIMKYNAIQVNTVIQIYNCSIRRWSFQNEIHYEESCSAQLIPLSVKETVNSSVVWRKRKSINQTSPLTEVNFVSKNTRGLEKCAAVDSFMEGRAIMRVWNLHTEVHTVCWLQTYFCIIHIYCICLIYAQPAIRERGLLNKSYMILQKQNFSF